MGLQRRRILVHRMLDFGERDTRLDRGVALFLLVLIASNVVMVIVETIAPVYRAYKPFFDGFELFSIAVCSLECLLRVRFCTADPHYRHPLFGRLRWILSPLGLIDLLAVRPSYLAAGADPSQGLRNSLRASRAVRLALLRLRKLARSVEALRTTGRALATTARSSSSAWPSLR